MTVIHMRSRRGGPTEPGPIPVEQRLATYCRMIESLERDDFDFIRGLYNYRVHYSSPLCDVRGVDRMALMLSDLFERCESPRLMICDSAVSGQHGFIYWKFLRDDRRADCPAVVGVSRVLFDGYGRVVSHRDIWDASDVPRRPLAGLRDRLRRWFSRDDRPRHYKAKPFQGSPPF